MPDPRRKPVELKILDGTYRKDRHGPPPEEKPEPIVKPKGLGKNVSKKWDEFAKMLAPVLRATDAPLLFQLCDLWCKRDALDAELAKMKPSARGYARRLGTVLSLGDRIEKLSRLFGMTPVDRAKLRFELSGPKRGKSEPDKPKVNLPPPAAHG